MKNIYLKIAKLLLLVTMVISVAIWIFYTIEIVDEDIFLGWSYVLLGLASLAAVTFPVLFLVLNPKNAKGALIGVVGIAIVVIVSYILADSTVPTFLGAEQFGIDESYSKQISTGLYTMYLFMFLSFAAIIYIESKN
jgi:galactitol-specific phosphotransferase system IIC component